MNLLNEEERELGSPDSKRAKISGLQLQNGYYCMFTKEPPEHLQIECSICLCVLSDPRMVDCNCGACFCQLCIQPTLTGKKPCPLCNSPITTSLPDRRLQRTLNNLEVYCSFKETGCEWVGKLGILSQHLNVNSSDNYKRLGCPFFLLKCCYCKENFQRQYVLDHEQNMCLKRPFHCDCCNEYESIFEDVTTKHAFVCPSQLVPCPNECGETLQRKSIDDHLASNCSLEAVNCPYSCVGCDVKLPRKEIPGHINENLAVHMSLQAADHQRQLDKLKSQLQDLEKANYDLKQEVKTLRSEEVQRLRSEQLSMYTHLHISPVILLMDGFAALRREGKVWVSQPFHTHLHGYKMRLAVNVNSCCDVEGMHVSMFIQLMRGEFDNQLKWPFQSFIAVQLLNQEEDKDHKVQVIIFTDAPGCPTQQVTKGDAHQGWGRKKFISHDELHPKYLKNDSLYFRVSSDKYCDVIPKP